VYVTLTFTASLVWYLPIAALSVDGGYLPAGFGTVGVGVLALMLAGSLVAILTSFRAIATGDVSYVAPISKLIPVFVLPLELVVLDERLSPLQATGAGVATAAVYVANYEPGKLADPLSRAARSQPARLALASAASFGVVDVAKRALTRELAVPPVTVNLALFGALPLALAPAAAQRIPDGVRGDAGHFLAVGVLLGEKALRIRLLAAGLVVAGVTFIALG